MTTDKPTEPDEYDSLDDWWMDSPIVDLSRSDWSIIVDALIEQAQYNEIGDHIDKMAAKNQKEVVERIRNQADIEPPKDLLIAHGVDVQ